MTCEVVRAYLPELIDGSLPDDTAADSHKHIMNCDSCAELYYTLRAANPSSGAEAGHESSEELRESAQERLEDLQSASREP